MYVKTVSSVVSTFLSSQVQTLHGCYKSTSLCAKCFSESQLMYLIDRIDAFLDSEKALRWLKWKHWIFTGLNLLFWLTLLRVSVISIKITTRSKQMTMKYIFLTNMGLTKMKFWGVFCFFIVMVMHWGLLTMAKI